MVTDEYIHINEAAEKYGKTRQTFYNYVNKGFIASKKLNNKLYLKKADIEKMVNDYIELLPDEQFSRRTRATTTRNPLQPEIAHEHAIPTSTQTDSEGVHWYDLEEPTTQEDLSPIGKHESQGNFATLSSLHTLQDDLLRLQKQLLLQQNTQATTLHNIKEEIVIDLKNNLSYQEQKILSALHQQEHEVINIQTHLLSQEITQRLLHKKVSFWVGYMGVLGIQLLILWLVV